MLNFDYLKVVAKKYNFDNIGVSQPFIDPFFKDKFIHALDTDLYDGMRWILNKKDIRLNPVKYFPWLKSILVFIDNYFFPQRKNFPMISKYALGFDYHQIVKTRICSVMEEIKGKYKELIYKVYVDYGSFLEKVYAVQAGLGSYGKNSIVYFDSLGSYCFVGLALVNMDIIGYIKKEISVDICGDCDICIRSCPTGAIIKPYVIDPSKCISYLTVEKKGEFTDGERNYIKESGYFYGCDICQDVCPLNKNLVSVTKKSEYFKNKSLFEEGFEKLYPLDLVKFKKLFKSSAIVRIGFDRFKRNLEIFR